MVRIARLRVDQSAVSYADINAYLDRRSFGGFGTFELGRVTEKPHCHYVIHGFEDDKAVQAFRVDLKRKFPALNRSNYSVSVSEDPERYDRYVAKGKSADEPPEVIWRHSLLYSLEKIAELHAAYWEENASTRKRKSEESSSSMLDFVVDEAKRARIPWNERHTLSMIYLKEMTARRKAVNMFAAKSVINAVQLVLCPTDECASNMADMI